MSCVYLTSDWHLNHKNILKFRSKLNLRSVEEHNSMIIENYCNVIAKRDIVWFLGDICFDKEALTILHALPGDKRLILGNHDTDCNKRCSIEELSQVFTSIHGMYKYKWAWLTHAPIHPMELRGKINIHGHSHEETVDDDRYVNVCLEHTDYKPIKYQEIINGRQKI